MGKKPTGRNEPNTYISNKKTIEKDFLRSQSMLNQYFGGYKSQSPNRDCQYCNQVIVSMLQFHTCGFKDDAKIRGNREYMIRYKRILKR